MKKKNGSTRILKVYIMRHGPLLAKGIAYSLLMGCMPFLFLSFSLASLLYQALPDLHNTVHMQIAELLPAQTGDFIINTIDSAARGWASVGALGIAILLFVAKGIYESMESGISAIMGISKQRIIWRNQLYAILFTLIGILFLLTASVGEMLITAKLKRYPIPPVAYTLMIKAFSVFLLGFVIFTMYLIAGSGRIDLLYTFCVSLSIAVIWKLIGVAGQFVIIQSGRRAVIYGILASTVLFLFWLKVFAHLVLLGGVLISRKFDG
ncbi:MAG: hypothetical protein GF401_06395 [Chitinivibrionales bacterium]|nr:hypothetical protein [Chitinivibrionales bacterium]